MEGDIAVGENVWEVRDDLASPVSQDAIKVRYGGDFPPSRHRTASRLITTAILGVVLPLVLLGGIAFFFLAYHPEIVEAGFARSHAAPTENIVRTDLMAQASGVARQIDAFLIERIVEVKAWAAAPTAFGAERAAEGQRTSPAVIENPEEIAQLDDAVSRPCRAFTSVLERHRHRG